MRQILEALCTFGVGHVLSFGHWLMDKLLGQLDGEGSALDMDPYYEPCKRASTPVKLELPEIITNVTYAIFLFLQLILDRDGPAFALGVGVNMQPPSLRKIAFGSSQIGDLHMFLYLIVFLRPMNRPHQFKSSPAGHSLRLLQAAEMFMFGGHSMMKYLGVSTSRGTITLQLKMSIPQRKTVSSNASLGMSTRIQLCYRHSERGYHHSEEVINLLVIRLRKLPQEIVLLLH